MVMVFVCIRTLHLSAMWLTLPAAIGVTYSVPTYLTVQITVTVLTIGSCCDQWRHGRLMMRPWGHVDVAMAMVAFVALTLTSPSSIFNGTWAYWAPGFAMGTAAALGGWCVTTRGALLSSSCLGVVYLLAAADKHGTDVWTVLGNALAFPAFGVGGALLARALRNLARQARDARLAAARSARELEAERYRLAVHDTASVLRMLGDKQQTQEVVALLRQQAPLHAARLRTYMNLAFDTITRDPVGDSADDEAMITLAGLVRQVTPQFADLPLDVVLFLAEAVTVDGAQIDPLRDALATVLHNVRNHAQATRVTIHGDSERVGSWELQVNDNGRGFDPATTSFGYGLVTQVLQQCHAVGIRVTIASSLGAGTRITFHTPSTDTQARP